MYRAAAFRFPRRFRRRRLTCCASAALRRLCLVRSVCPSKSRVPRRRFLCLLRNHRVRCAHPYSGMRRSRRAAPRRSRGAAVRAVPPRRKHIRCAAPLAAVCGVHIHPNSRNSSTDPLSMLHPPKYDVFSGAFHPVSTIPRKQARHTMRYRKHSESVSPRKDTNILYH